MRVKIKKLHPDAKLPFYSREGDAGMDLTALEVSFSRTQVTYTTGISVEIPEGYVGLIFPRSSIYKTNLSLSNCVGVIDSNYRGEIKFIFNLIDLNLMDLGAYKVGDRIGQLIIIPYPKIEWEEVDSLTDTIRGAEGFGSSGQ